MLRSKVIAPVVLTVTMAAPAGAATWGIGAGAGTRPALSLQVEPVAGTGTSYHATSHLSDERIVVTADLQRRAVPTFGYRDGWRLGFYGGVGVEGLSERHGEGTEAYRLRLPLGGQCDVRAAALSVFAEGALAVGPLPASKPGWAALAGLRAVL